MNKAKVAGATNRAFRALSHVITQDLGGRGTARLSEGTEDGLRGAAASLLANAGSHVLLLTGFYVPQGHPPCCETDGPTGTAQLAAALWGLGFTVTVVTDAPCGGAVTAAIEGVGLDPATAAVVPVAATVDELQVLVSTREAALGRISACVSVERAGPAADGKCRNMRGEDISQWQAPFQDIFARSPVTIAIGDGGNELGMGSLPASLVAQEIEHGSEIHCIIPSDHLIVAGVSNWGAWGLIMAMGLLDPEAAVAMLELTPRRDLRLLEAVVSNGPSVDGVTGRQTLSVDGLEHSVHAAQLEALQQIIHTICSKR